MKNKKTIEYSESLYNTFFDKLVLEFKLDKEEDLIEIECSNYYKTLQENIFSCRFLIDSIKKGVKQQKEILANKKREIIRETTEPEFLSLIENYNKLEDNIDLILILAYDFFVDYLEKIISQVLRNNKQYLIGIENITYNSKEILAKENVNYNFIEDLIKIYLRKNKHSNNVLTNYIDWVNVFEKIKLNLNDDFITFFSFLHLRRNAASHKEIIPLWKEKSKNLKNTNQVYWLYGILFLAKEIDSIINQKFKIEIERYKFNFKGNKFYNIDNL